MGIDSETLWTPKIVWPEGKQFAFTVFDDADWETLENVGGVYSLLADCGLRTTKSCWVVRGDPDKGYAGGANRRRRRPLAMAAATCSRRDSRSAGTARTWHSLPRRELTGRRWRSSPSFSAIIPSRPRITPVDEAIYWGSDRLTGFHSFLYNLLTALSQQPASIAATSKATNTSGATCAGRRSSISAISSFRTSTRCGAARSCRTTTRTGRTSTIGLPRPTAPRCSDLIAASPSGSRTSWRRRGAPASCTPTSPTVSPRGGKVDPQFEQLVRRLAAKNGWFVPVTTLLDYLLSVRRRHEITPVERRRLESALADDKAVRWYELSGSGRVRCSHRSESAMHLDFVDYREELTAAVAAFNRRLADGGQTLSVPGVAGARVAAEARRQKDLPGILRGRRRRGASPRRLHAQTPAVLPRTRRLSIGDFQLPISEGVVNRR